MIRGTGTTTADTEWAARVRRRATEAAARAKTAGTAGAARRRLREFADELRAALAAATGAAAADVLPDAIPPAPAAGTASSGSSALHSVAAAMRRTQEQAELAGLRERVADLKQSNRRLDAAAETARAEGEHAALEAAVRTHHGRIPSVVLCR